MKGNTSEREQPADNTHQDMILNHQVGTILFSQKHPNDT